MGVVHLYMYIHVCSQCSFLHCQNMETITSLVGMSVSHIANYYVYTIYRVLGSCIIETPCLALL